jgi:hypothetical protein
MDPPYNFQEINVQLDASGAKWGDLKTELINNLRAEIDLMYMNMANQVQTRYDQRRLHVRQRDIVIYYNEKPLQAEILSTGFFDEFTENDALRIRFKDGPGILYRINDISCKSVDDPGWRSVQWTDLHKHWGYLRRNLSDCIMRINQETGRGLTLITDSINQSSLNADDSMVFKLVIGNADFDCEWSTHRTEIIDQMAERDRMKSMSLSEIKEMGKYASIDISSLPIIITVGVNESYRFFLSYLESDPLDATLRLCIQEGITDGHTVSSIRNKDGDISWRLIFTAFKFDTRELHASIVNQSLILEFNIPDSNPIITAFTFHVNLNTSIASSWENFFQTRPRVLVHTRSERK